MPLMELARVSLRHLSPRALLLVRGRRRRPLDLQEFFTNFGGCRMVASGLNLLAKMISLPGKMGFSGHQV